MPVAVPSAPDIFEIVPPVEFPPRVVLVPSPTIVNVPVDELKLLMEMPLAPPLVVTLLKMKSPLPPPDRSTAAPLFAALAEVLMETSLTVAGKVPAPTLMPVTLDEATSPLEFASG